MRRMFLMMALSAPFLAGCGLPAPTVQSDSASGGLSGVTPAAQEAARNFTEVSRAVGGAATQECRRRTTDTNCSFLIQVDPDPRAPANAFQTIDDSGRPVIIFTAAMVVTARNIDELAFVMGHETAHHIADHLDRQAVNAAASAAVFAGLAELTGGSARDVSKAEELGAVVGARSFSKEFELEADRLGTVITHRAGYDPLKGAQFFARIPDPGNRFLGTHPPNAARMEVVRQTARELGLSP
ncbi:M48 family metallopeptidase [Primorskyibacter sp. S87]|uniref:M48 family metallopeptidase n=1 Tax=Primorskyibacter sp. S87 TaxID=3415126 RepID=UPI003C7C174D